MTKALATKETSRGSANDSNGAIEQAHKGGGIHVGTLGVRGLGNLMTFIPAPSASRRDNQKSGILLLGTATRQCVRCHKRGPMFHGVTQVVPSNRYRETHVLGGLIVTVRCEDCRYSGGRVAPTAGNESNRSSD